MQRLVDIAPAQIPQIWALLSQIPDPEVPVLTITDLGMVRSVKAQGEGWVIGFTPTYSGCPATEHLLGAIRETLTGNLLGSGWPPHKGSSAPAAMRWAPRKPLRWASWKAPCPA